jgi:hypothetical protein
LKSALIENLVKVADAYCAATGQSRASVAKTIFGRGGHFDDLANGVRDLATGTHERALAWFAGNWPEDAAWPADIARPDSNDAGATQEITPEVSGLTTGAVVAAAAPAFSGAA